MIEVRRSASRFVTRDDGIVTRHSFSFGEHYDPANVGFGILVAHNDESIRPGAGYAEHSHGHIEIVTWVVSGVLRHQDSLGTAVDLRPGMAAVTQAASGVRHSERNASATGPLRFVQTWLRPPDGAGQPEPTFAVADVRAKLGSAAFVAVASGLPGIDAAARLGPPATLCAARITEGAQVDLPIAARLHVFVVTGAVTSVEAGELAGGDALRVEAAPGGALTALRDTELLVWSLPDSA
ncbi:MAG: pirin family protein [Nocardioidaceae bacterium]